MKRNFLLIVPVFLTVLGSQVWAKTVREDATQRLENSAQVLKDVATAPDQGIPDEVVQRARCIVVFPNLLKAGLIVGGKYGHGVAVCRTTGKGGWSEPAFITIGGGTWGPQIGAEDLDLVMMVMTDKGLQKLLSDKVQFTLEGSAVAGPVGRHASVGAGWKQDTEILTYAHTKGAFAGQTLESASVGQDDDATKAVYGSDVSFNKVLRGSAMMPAAAAPFLKAVAEISHEAAAAQARQQMPESQKK
jgi:lipid-binding SYLF domain-containing protein